MVKNQISQVRILDIGLNGMTMRTGDFGNTKLRDHNGLLHLFDLLSDQIKVFIRHSTDRKIVLIDIGTGHVIGHLDLTNIVELIGNRDELRSCDWVHLACIISGIGLKLDILCIGGMTKRYFKPIPSLNCNIECQQRETIDIICLFDGFGSLFDFIFVDCPPSLGVITMNALAWAESIIIPMQCEYFSMEGLNLLMRTVSNVRKGLNPDIRILGILFTMYSKRSRLNAEVIQDTSNFFPDLVFKTVIPRSVRLAEAPSYGLPINVYDISNAGTKAYSALAREVVDRL